MRKTRNSRTRKLQYNRKTNTKSRKSRVRKYRKNNTKSRMRRKTNKKYMIGGVGKYVELKTKGGVGLQKAKGVAVGKDQGAQEVAALEAARVAERALSRATTKKMKVEAEIESRKRVIESIEDHISSIKNNPANKNEVENFLTQLAEHKQILAELQQTLANANIELERLRVI